MKPYLTALYIFLLSPFFSLGQKDDEVQIKALNRHMMNRSQTYQKEPDIAECDKKIMALDVMALKNKKKEVKVASWLKKGKLMPFTLYYKDSIPLKLVYPGYDVEGEFVDNSIIYFDESGAMYGGVINLASRKIVNVFLGNHNSVVYTKDIKGHIAQNNEDRKTQRYWEQNYAYWIDFYMQFFPSFKYSRYAPAADAPPVLRIAKDNVDLLDVPGGKTILKLKKGDYLNYLDKRDSQLEYKGRKWIFLKVSTLHKKIGWVLGDPAIINDEGDE